MKEFIFKKIYTISMWVMGLSLVLMLFVQGFVPFGVTVAWAEKNIGSSLVFIKPSATVEPGKTVVGNTDVQGMVTLYKVENTVRQNGTLHYKVMTAGIPDQVTTMQAQALGRTVLFSIPLIGVWVRILNNTLGVLTLIGLPFFMVAIQAVMVVLRGLTPILRALEQKSHIRKERKLEMREVRREKRRIAKKEKYPEYNNSGEPALPQDDDQYVTVLKPYNMRRRYGM